MYDLLGIAMMASCVAVAILCYRIGGLSRKGLVVVVATAVLLSVAVLMSTPGWKV